MNREREILNPTEILTTTNISGGEVRKGETPDLTHNKIFQLLKIKRILRIMK